MRSSTISACLLAALTLAAVAAEKYDGPRPDKPDIPYLKHASKLIPLETGQMKEEGSKKDESVMAMSGANSPTRTPLAEPIFLFTYDRLDPMRLELYKIENNKGRREIKFKKKGPNGPRPFKIMVNPLGGKLYRIDVNETLDNGQYCFSPTGADQVFCFEVY
jgi:hypothetical protein